MADEIRYVPLYGRIILTGQIETKTGLHIGGNATGVEIGGIDNIILRNPISQLPYIPGSSLKGKMRSLYERYTNVPINHKIDRVRIHSSHKDNVEYSDVSHIYGMPAEGDREADHPTPLIVRDVELTSIDGRMAKDLIETSEVKWEAVIDRITAAAVPRQMERVPAGAIFEPLEIIYNVYGPGSGVRDLVPEVFVALQLVEDDYLGGSGSRGYGKVQFTELKVTCKRRNGENNGENKKSGRYEAVAAKDYKNLEELLSDEGFEAWVQENIPVME